MSFKFFEEIEAWQDTRSLMKKMRVFYDRARKKRDWTWIDQVNRSMLSIMANIAEGNDAQTDAEFATFLGYAKRSSAESRSHFYYGYDQGYITEEEFPTLLEEIKSISRKLASLISYLRMNRRKTPRSIIKAHK